MNPAIIIAREYVAERRSRTRCAKCEAQPIIWHHPDLDGCDNGANARRVGDLANRGADIAALDAEIARCVPLCGKCHFLEHFPTGRICDGAIGRWQRDGAGTLKRVRS